MKSRHIHVTGTSGSGATSLGRALADALALPHRDVDDYFWLPTVPPYRTQRDVAERLRLMREVFLPRADWVLSGSLGSWGDPLIPHFDLVIFLTTPPEIRLQRLRAREAAHFGADAMRWDPAAGGTRKPKNSLNGPPVTKPAIARAVASPDIRHGSPNCPARSCVSMDHSRWPSWLRKSAVGSSAEREGRIRLRTAAEKFTLSASNKREKRCMVSGRDASAT